MKMLCSALLFFISLSAMARPDIYICKSNEGVISIFDNGDSVKVDLSYHQVINMDYSYTIFSEMVNESRFNYQNYVLQISTQNFVPERGRKFRNSWGKIVLKSELSSSLSTCSIDLVLNKRKLAASLEYKCSTMFKVYQKLEDNLFCRVD